MPPALQRRYSVTGQTPPDNVGMKSPKIQALNPTVQTNCHLCESAGTQEIARRPSKRDAAQLPSPTSFDQHALPTKIARLDLSHEDVGTDPSEIDSSYEPSPLLLGLPTPPKTPPNERPQPLTLLSLPPEIRSQIYRYLPDTLISSRPLIYCLSTFKGRKQHPLAAVCRQIRRESLAIFYGYNTWVIKLEFKIMYDAFRAWIQSIGDENAGSLRLIQLSVRGREFRPQVMNPAPLEYVCVDGDACFKIDLSERWKGGKVEVMRCDGSKQAGEFARQRLEKLVAVVWEKRCKGTLKGADWIMMVDQFLGSTGWWI